MQASPAAAAPEEVYARPGVFALERYWLAAAALSSVVAAAFALVLWPSPRGVVVALALAGMVVCAWSDLRSFRVPNAITYTGTIVVLATALTVSVDALVYGLAGAGFGGGFFLILNLVSRGKVGMGDVKMATFGGSLVGISYVIQALFLGAMLGACASLVLLVSGRVRPGQAIPYAPFLAFGFIIAAALGGIAYDL